MIKYLRCLSSIATTVTFLLFSGVSNAQVGPAGVNAGILLWLDGSNVNNTSPATNPANNALVTTWRDISGNNNHATILAGQNTPVMSSAQINGKDVVRFVRTSQVLGTVYNVPTVDIRSSVRPQITILTVYRQGAKTAADQHGIWGDDNGNWDRFFMSSFFSDNGVVAVGPPTNNVPVTNAGVQGEVKLLTAVYDRGVVNGSTVYFNAIPVQSVTDNTDPTAAQSTLRIGWDGDDNAFNGDIAEMIVYNRKLTDCEIKTVNRYLGYKYNVNLTTASITPSPAAYFCTGNSVVLTGASSIAGASFTWLRNGSLIAGANASTYAAGIAGNYRVIATVAGCPDTSVITTVKEVFPRLYVNGSVAVTGTGASWASPLKTVSEALDFANSVNCATEIWVRSGTYFPMLNNYTTVTSSRDSSFRILRNNIRLYGGFAGTETLLSQRNITANLTTLSGDINVAGDSLDNCYHVMTIVGTAANNIDNNTVVDGFTVTQGMNNDNNATITVNGMVIYRGAGGGINCAGLGAGSKSSPLIENVTFLKNTAVWGGGLYCQAHQSGQSNPLIKNCSFVSNTGTADGGAIHAFSDGAGGSASPTALLCTFTNNRSLARGAGYYANATAPAVANVVARNCTFTGNTSPSAAGNQYGGAFLLLGTASTGTVISCNFTNNSANYGAGALGLNVLVLNIDSCTFNNNTSAADGGGIYMQGGTLSLANSTFNGNKAAAGAGVAVAGTSSMTMNNCTVTNDSVSLYGSGIGYYTAQTSTVNNSRFISNHGAVVGVIDNAGDGILNVNESVFSGNTTNQVGAVVNNYAGTTNFRNSVFVNNSCNGVEGGGVAHVQGGSTVNVFNSTGNNNTTNSATIPDANAFSVDAGATLNINNSIFWGAAAKQVGGGGTINYAYSNIKGITPAGNNISANPFFINPSDPDGADNIWATADDGLQLLLCSPSANTGSNALIPAGVTTDYKNGPRIQQAIVDMGAYESNNTPVTVLYVDGGVAVSGAGTSWASPLKTVSQALEMVNYSNCANEIWVKGGTYYPMTDAVTKATSRDSSFRILKNGIKLYGGFAGTETLLSQRNIAANLTVLSGDLGVLNNKADNSYHVMTVVSQPANNINSSTVVSGFTITKGNGNVSVTTTVNGVYSITSDGGGIALIGSGAGNNCSPQIDSCIITQNNAGVGGAIYCGSYLSGSSSPVIFDCVISRDTASNIGGIHSYGSSGSITSPTMTRCIFEFNRGGNGGALGAFNAGGATISPKAINCIFSNNSSSGAGGVFNFFSAATFTATNCIFTNNIADGTTAGGGVMHIASGATANFNNCTISENTTLSTANPNSNTILNDAGGTFNLNNTILWGAAAVQIANAGTANYNYSDVKGIPAAGTNISTDPLFFNAADPNGADNIWATADDGLNLMNCSPSINTGSNALIPAGITTDVTNGPRIIQAIVDMGAYEKTYVVPPVQSVSITASQNPICTGGSITFTATPVNGGPTPAYQWQVNGINAGTNSPTFTSATLVNGDVVTVIMTGSLVCVTPTTPVTSNQITVSVVTNVTPSVSIAITTGSQNICAGTSVTFTATPVNGGTAPTYQWQVNGINAGTNAPTFTSTTLANNDAVTVIMTSNFGCLSSNNPTSNTITMTVGTNLTPSVNIAITTGTQTICAGTSVTFTATPMNGGAAPIYQWQVNGINAGTNAPTFTSATLANNDAVTVIMTSNSGCLTSNNPTSNSIVMTVNPNLTPSVSIAITSGTQTICAGTSVTFTATAVNGGTAPVYQWQVNGINAGTNAPTFTSTTLANNDAVTVILTSNANCVTANNIVSNSITMTVNPNLTPTVSIAITSGAQTICAGTSVTFTASITNGGTTPAYQWKVNGINAGTNTTTFTSATLANNDVVTVVLTSSETCLTGNNIVSNSITMTVNPNLTPSVSIAITAGSQTICAGTSVTFTATPVNGGGAPSYQWKINGINAGPNAPAFTSTTFADNDVITVTLTSSETCLTTNNVISNSIMMTVNPVLTPEITITGAKPSFCENAPATFTATIMNGGPTPFYQWKVNGINVGPNSATFTIGSLNDNDIVNCELTTSVVCYTALTVTGNVIIVDVQPVPVLTLNANTEILQGGSVQLSAASTVPVTTYLWTPSSSLNDPTSANPVASPSATTVYRLEATSAFGCTGSATTEVKVVEGPQIANTFTPNNDGIHDFWEIKNLTTYPNCRVQVFTRMGQLVFESIGYSKPWDGNFKGKSLPADTYYYILEMNNKIKSKPVTGYITILK